MTVKVNRLILKQKDPKRLRFGSLYKPNILYGNFRSLNACCNALQLFKQNRSHSRLTFAGRQNL